MINKKWFSTFNEDEIKGISTNIAVKSISHVTGSLAQTCLFQSVVKNRCAELSTMLWYISQDAPYMNKNKIDDFFPSA